MPEFKHGDEGYFDDPAYSQSDLKAVLDCPQLLWEMKHNGGRRKLPTAAMQSGTIIHKAVLEPYTFSDVYVPCPPQNTKTGKAAAKAAQDNGLEPITTLQNVTAWDVAGAINQHPLAKQLLTDGQPEVSIYGEDASTGLKIKGKLDWLDDQTIVDLKTVGLGGASPAAFTKQIVNFKYHLQAAHYLELAQAKTFIFLVVEREPPYQIGIYELDNDALTEGRWLRKKALDTVAFCRAANSWPGYTPNQPQTLSLPSWGFDS
tara:strand:+ start:2926 stop:3705 length:780 start_codon:yes stop_codon:yes gene_type:complete